MKIFKLVPAIGVFAFCVSFGSLRAQDNPAQAAAREALMKQMDQVQAPEAPPAASAAAKPAAPAAAPAIPETKPAAPAASAPVAAPVMIITNPAPPATVTPSGPVPIIAPALPISMTKEQRLQALLAKYKADQINPEEYHKQRAAILAEP
ncbi:MAG TPA: hypothetical protein VNN22_16380 [Verrucomicrobiae bacterium]|nr:hypothetical protein [Verrucomicrobiae bacterium]